MNNAEYIMEIAKAEESFCIIMGVNIYFFHDNENDIYKFL